MKFETIHRVIIKEPLSNYHEAYGDTVLHIWVNIPRTMIERRAELDFEYSRLIIDLDLLAKKFRKELAAVEGEDERKKLVSNREKEQAKKQKELDTNQLNSQTWFSELWSQGPEGERWPVEDIQLLEEKDPMLLGWMADRTREVLATRRVDQKNA